MSLLKLVESIKVIEGYQALAAVPESIEIPRVLFQFWDKPAPPEEIKMLLARNSELCDLYNIEYLIINDEEARAFIKKYFSNDIYEAYDISPHPAMKSDLFRLCFLYQNGGYYLDADMVATGRIKELFELKGRFVCFQWDVENRTNACNWLIGAVANLELVEYAVNIVANSITSACTINKQDALKNILAVSGPGIFSRIVGTYISNCQQSEWAGLSLNVEKVSYAHKLVNNGPSFLKRPFEYKSTDLHWLTAANNNKQL